MRVGGRDSGEGEGGGREMGGRESERKREWESGVCEVLICRDGIWAI